MSLHPFYITWSKQKDALTYPLDGVDQFHVISNGEKKVDLSSISYQASFGLTPTFVTDRIKKQIDNYTIVAPKAVFPLKTNTTNRLLKLINLDGGKIFYTTSGSESVENALKMARLYTGKKTILARKPSYHGATLGAVSVTGDWRNQDVPTLDQWTLRIPEPKTDPDLVLTRKLIEKHGPEKIAGIILETVPGNNGILLPNEDWLQKIQLLAKEYNFLLILDEVICGFYRLGTPFGFQKFKLKPDIITMAKAITAGVVPFGAVWTSDKIHSHFHDRVLSCGLTSYAHPIGLAALEAVLEYTESKDFQFKMKSFMTQFNKDLTSLKKPTDTRVIGALAAIDLKNPPSWHELWKVGLSVIAQKDRLILAPHLNMDMALWSSSFKKLESLIEK